MTTDTTPDPTTDDPGHEPDEVEQHEPDDGGAEQRDPAAAREQRLRARAREAETERDALRERLARYQRAEVEAVAAEVLANGGDLLALRPDLTALLDQDGAVDPALVRAAAEEVAVQRPHWRIASGEEPGRRQVRGRPYPSRADKSGTGWGAVISRPGR